MYKQPLGSGSEQKYGEFRAFKFWTPHALSVDFNRAPKPQSDQERIIDEEAQAIERRFGTVRVHQIPREIHIGGYKGRDAVIAMQRVMRAQRNLPRGERPRFRRVGEGAQTLRRRYIF